MDGYLTVIMSLVAILAGAGVSWLFFRAQQQTDFQRLMSRLDNLGQDLTKVVRSGEVSEKIDLSRDLAEIRAAVYSLSEDVGGLAKEILSDVGRQQNRLLDSVQARFLAQVKESNRALRASIESELKGARSVDREGQVVDNLVQLVGNAIQTMGNYQRIAIEEESRAALDRVEKTVTSAVREVSDDVGELRKRIDAFPVALPPAGREVGE